MFQEGLTPLHELAVQGKSERVLYLMENFNTNLDVKEVVSILVQLNMHILIVSFPPISR